MRAKQTRKRREILIAVGVAIGLAGVIACSAFYKSTPAYQLGKSLATKQSPPAIAEPLPVIEPVKPIDKAAIRSKSLTLAMDKLEAAEKEFDLAATKIADKHLATIDAFFESRKAGVPTFAKQILSLGGKWKFVRGQLWKEDEDKHAKFVRTEFEKYVFTPAELSEVVSRAISGYLTELQGLENQFLIQLRADLGEADPAAAEAIPAIASQEVFDREYKRVATLAASLIGKDLKADVAKEVASFIAGDLAAKVGLKVLSGIAARLGVSGGILATGAASSLGTLGIGIIAAIAADLALDRILKAAGHDPVMDVAKRVNQSLGGIRDSIKEGIDEAKDDWKELLMLAKDDPDEEVRKQAEAAADSIARSGNLGLRRELLQLHELRVPVRREAIKRLILTEEGNP